MIGRTCAAVLPEQVGDVMLKGDPRFSAVSTCPRTSVAAA